MDKFSKNCKKIWKSRIDKDIQPLFEEDFDRTIKRTVKLIKEHNLPSWLCKAIEKELALRLDRTSNTAINHSVIEKNKNGKKNTSRVDEARRLIYHLAERYIENKNAISSNPQLVVLDRAIFARTVEELNGRVNHQDNSPYFLIKEEIVEKAEILRKIDLPQVDVFNLFYTEPLYGFLSKKNKWYERDTKVLLDRLGAKSALINGDNKYKVNLAADYAQNYLGMVVEQDICDACVSVKKLKPNGCKTLSYVNGGGTKNIEIVKDIKENTSDDDWIIMVFSKNGRQRNSEAKAKYLGKLGIDIKGFKKNDWYKVVEAFKQKLDYVVEDIRYKTGWVLIIKGKKSPISLINSHFSSEKINKHQRKERKSRPEKSNRSRKRKGRGVSIILDLDLIAQLRKTNTVGKIAEILGCGVETLYRRVPKEILSKKRKHRSKHLVCQYCGKNYATEYWLDKHKKWDH